MPFYIIYLFKFNIILFTTSSADIDREFKGVSLSHMEWVMCVPEKPISDPAGSQIFTYDFVECCAHLQYFLN